MTAEGRAELDEQLCRARPHACRGRATGKCASPDEPCYVHTGTARVTVCPVGGEEPSPVMYAKSHGARAADRGIGGNVNERGNYYTDKQARHRKERAVVAAAAAQEPDHAG